MALFSPVPLAPLKLENKDLPLFSLLGNCAYHAGLGHERCSQMSGFFITDQEYPVEAQLLSHLTAAALHIDEITLVDPILFTTGFDYGVQNLVPPSHQRTPVDL